MTSRNDFTTATVDGVDVQTVDGNCWQCEENNPTEAAVITVGGMLSLTVGLCEACSAEHE